MALDIHNAGLVIDLIKSLTPPTKVLAFGHPDLIVTDEEMERHFGLDGDEGGAHVPLRQLGAELLVVDRRPGMGVDEVADLSAPLPRRHRNSYDMVIDSGTIEHVFNIGQAFATIVKVLRVGGIVYHCNPLMMPNHGYWSFSPVAYHDFYEANGFEILRLDRQRKSDFIPLQRVDRFRLENDGKVMQICVARKVSEVGEIRFPMQEKYLLGSP